MINTCICGNNQPIIREVIERGFLSENYQSFQVYCANCKREGKPSQPVGMNPGDPVHDLSDIVPPEVIADKILDHMAEYLVKKMKYPEWVPQHIESVEEINAKNVATQNWNDGKIQNWG